jgi:hypothetical protein
MDLSLCHEWAASNDDDEILWVVSSADGPDLAQISAYVSVDLDEGVAEIVG